MSPEIFDKWQHIVDDVSKTKIPVEFIKKLVVKLNGRRQHTINIQTLIRQGYESDEIEEIVAKRLEELDESMVGIEFVLDIQSVADAIQPETDNLLRKL